MYSVKDSILRSMSEDGRDELMEFINYMDEIRSELESRFGQYEFIGNADGMVKTFDKLIDYGMVESGDRRLCEKNVYQTDANGKRVKIKQKFTGFDKATISGNSYYRPKQSTNYIGVWPFSGLTRWTGTIVQSIEHWGIRAEKGYEAPVTFAANIWPISLKLVDNAPNAEQAAAGIVKILSENGAVLKPTDQADITGFLVSGYQRVYTIRCDKWAAKNQNIGYVRLFGEPTDNGMEIRGTVYINWKIIVRQYIPLNKFVSELNRLFSEVFKRFNVSFDTTGYDKAHEYEKTMVEKNNIMAAEREGIGMIDVEQYK